jgi:hypothetical protein
VNAFFRYYIILKKIPKFTGNVEIGINRGRSSTNFRAGGANCLSGRKREDKWGKKKIAIISAYEHTKLKHKIKTNCFYVVRRAP